MVEKQEESENYPVVLELDGIFYRVCRGGKWQNRCFSDLTKAEQEAFMSTLSPEGLKQICLVLSESLRTIASVALSLEMQVEINKGLEQANAENLIPADDVFAALKKKYGL